MGNKRGNKQAVIWQDIRPANMAAGTGNRRNKKAKFKRIRIHFKHLKILAGKHTLITLLVLVSIVCIVCLTVLVTNLISSRSSSSDNHENTESSSSKGILVPGTPKYKILLPANKSIDQLGGGWIRNDSQNLFVYVDKIGTTKINVSEQPLPENLKDNTVEEVETIAKTYNITERINIGQTAVYIGTFDKGLQRIIFSKSDLLILMTSNDNLTNDEWIQYISSMS